MRASPQLSTVSPSVAGQWASSQAKPCSTSGEAKPSAAAKSYQARAVATRRRSGVSPGASGRRKAKRSSAPSTACSRASTLTVASCRQRWSASSASCSQLSPKV